MVVFVDLDDESEPPEDIRLRSHWDINGHNHGNSFGNFGIGHLAINEARSIAKEEVNAATSRTIEKQEKMLVAQALGCYPYVVIIPNEALTLLTSVLL